MPSPRDPVLAIYAALESGDVDAALDGLHPDVSWCSSVTMPWGRAVEGRTGRGAVREYLTSVGESLDATVDIDDIIECGDRVVTLGTIRGKGRETGTPLDCRFAHVWQVRDGQIVAHRGFPDTAAVLQALESAA